ncbi:MAG: ABC transporter permease [Oscillospiraceae bacterium]|nr:ABC transporter permease [Oscillospiraceae bacterium]
MMHLLKKELSELLTKQMLIGLIVSVAVMFTLGFAMRTAFNVEDLSGDTIRLIDVDRTDFTQKVVDRLEAKGYEVIVGVSFEKSLAQDGWKNAVEIPAGLTDSLLTRHEPAELISHTSLTTVSVMSLSMGGSSGCDAVATAIREELTAELFGNDYDYLNSPVTVMPRTYANGKSADADPSMIVSSVAMYDMFMPLVLFLLVVLTSQTIIGAIAVEKTDKTLETLLSAPVPRSRIIGAKMLAALIVALIYAAVYGIGFFGFMLFTVSSGVDMNNMNVGGAFTSLVEAHNAVQTLGLEITGLGWLGVIAQLLLTLGISLTASIILGGLVEDAKGSQTASMPILFCTMFPYILTMVTDIRSMETGTRLLLYAVPFTHTFIATSCMHFHDYTTFWGGLAYQAVFLAVVTVFALKLYSSDLLFVNSRTHRLRAKRKAQE